MKTTIAEALEMSREIERIKTHFEKQLEICQMKLSCLAEIVDRATGKTSQDTIIIPEIFATF